MSAHPGVGSPRRPIHSAGSVLTLGCLLVLAACDQPTQPEVFDTAQFITATSTTCTALAAGGDTKTVNVNVELSTGADASGVIVTLIHPTQGPDCYGATDANGTVSFPNITRGAQFVVSVRDEVSIDAPRLEIGPAAPNQIALNLLFDEPSIAATRQQPTLVSGAACTTENALTWGNYIAGRAAPCVVPTTGSPRFNVDVELVSTPVLNIEVLNPDGTPAGETLVAAISTPAGSIEDACAEMPWLNQVQCKNANQFSGPGLIQAMSVTQNGLIGLGVAQGSSPMFIEVTAPQAGFTLFGTLELGVAATNDAAQTVYLAPGMCKITEVDDAVEPSDFSELDIQYSQHSVGLRAAADGLDPMQLERVPSTIVVRAVIHATAPGGTGNFTFQYAGPSGGNKTIRLPFSISGETCTPGTASGNGITGDVAAVGYCTDKGTVGNRTVYDLYFTVTGLPSLSRAGYNIDAAKDNLDPSRADGTGGRKLSRGSVDIDLTPTTCDVPTNNDGRWLIV